MIIQSALKRNKTRKIGYGSWVEESSGKFSIYVENITLNDSNRNAEQVCELAIKSHLVEVIELS